jgi:hypothetical protein
MRILLCIFIAALTGCRRDSSRSHKSGARLDSAAALLPLDAAKVTAIARQAIATNDTWIARSEFNIHRHETNGSWSVLVWRLPRTPGGHRLVLIDETGRIIQYVRGR